MQTQLDCIPCLIRQSLEAVRRVSDDVAVHGRVLRRVLQDAVQMDSGQPPPVMAARIHRLVADETGVDDPYCDDKRRSNILALGLVEELSAALARAGDRFDVAVRLAIAGNIIDFGVHDTISLADVRQSIRHALSADLGPGSIDDLRAAVATADTVLYLADNAGEIVLDRFLLEEIGCERITYAVKSRPIINDATVADVSEAEFPAALDVVETGSGTPGTYLEDCSASFRELFYGSNLIIAKGQANFETLSEVAVPAFFLLRVKCPVVAGHTGRQVGEIALVASPMAMANLR